MQQFVNCVQIDICIQTIFNDRLYIFFFNLYFKKIKCILYFLVMSNYMVGKKRQVDLTFSASFAHTFQSVIRGSIEWNLCCKCLLLRPLLVRRDTAP